MKKKRLAIWLLILAWLLQGGAGECAGMEPEMREVVETAEEEEIPDGLGKAEDFVAEDSKGEGSEPEESGCEDSKPEAVDQEPPRAAVVWSAREGGSLEDGGYSCSEELLVELIIQEASLDRAGTVFYLTAAGWGGEGIACPEVDEVNGKSWGELWEMTQKERGDGEKGNGAEKDSKGEEDEGEEEEEQPEVIQRLVELTEEEGVYTLRLRLQTEADYAFSAVIQDEAGNQAGDGERVALGSCCLDRTAPQIRLEEDGDGRPVGDIVWSAKEQTFFQKLVYGLSFGYFCKPSLQVWIGAWDPVSGIESITYECEGRFGEEEEIRLLTETVFREELQKEVGEGRMYTVLDLPDSFRGTVRATSQDRAGNRMDFWSETVGLLAESEAMHEKSSEVRASVLEGEGKREGFYRGDVKLCFDLKDEFSGIRKAVLRAGTQEMMLSFEEEGEEAVTSASQEVTLLAKENNGNHVRVEAELTDFAGHNAYLVEGPVVHIDTKAPQVSVEWNNLDVTNEKYYHADREALIRVQERNFDPEDVQLELKGMEVPELVWGHEPGGGCKGSQDPFDTGHGDGCSWTARLVFDRDGVYELGFSCRDAAGNTGSWGQVEAFVIDKTAPVISVGWNAAQAQHEKYFAQERRATVEITEQNFRPEDAKVEILAFDLEKDALAPVAGAFQGYGESWRAQALFDVEGRYQLRASCTDLAGNEAEVYLSEEFILDRTPPTMEFFGVEDQSANCGTVMPGLHIKDANRDPDACRVELVGITGAAVLPESTWKEWEREVFVRWEDFLYVPESDDLYRIRAVASDLAGNETVEELSFSVNRFGSVYVLEEKTERLAGAFGVRYTNREPELVVEEYNVDFLEAKRVFLSRDGEARPMEEGRDYTVEMSGDEESWKKYRYRIPERNFTKEGTYLVALYSEDRASNRSSSGRNEKSMEFVVDKTGPDIVLANVEDEGQYEGRSRRIRIDIQDPGGVMEAKLYRNGACDRIWSQEELRKGQGLLTYALPEADGWQTVQMWARDAAGNESETGRLKILVTEEQTIYFWERRLWQALLAGLGLTAAAWSLQKLQKGWQRKRKYNKKEA